MFPFINLPMLLYRRRQLLAYRERSFDLERWAEERGMELLALQHWRRPPGSVMWQFPPTTGYAATHFFRIDGIGPDHVHRSGVARVRHYEAMPLPPGVLINPRLPSGANPVIDVVWFTAIQLDPRSRPRRSARWPHDRAQGWHADHTGAHELRWYSAGTPTDLVKDGATESRDPPVNRIP
jgi:hypothetical protein